MDRDGVDKLRPRAHGAQMPRALANGCMRAIDGACRITDLVVITAVVAEKKLVLQSVNM